jgi:prepilin-type N-terminal cleavage/methylation domain-containing protein
MYSRNERGFTLVEIAIVLVIVGLLLGGVLKGQEMIVQAKIKNSISDFSGISAAYHGYLDRYRATPGDDINADRWTGATKGNGDRVLSGTYKDATATPEPESRLWWDHLRRSGFIAGSGADQPSNAFAGLIGVQTGDGASPPAAALGTFTSLITCSSNMPDKVAIAVDVQMDDGDARAGAVRAHLQSAAGNPAIAGTTPAANYVETGTTLYTLCRSF